MDKLHSMDIFHRDIKSANIFINNNDEAKLGDMNVSKIAKLGFVKDILIRFILKLVLRIMLALKFGEVKYLILDEPYGSKSDIWSLGCILYEMACLKPPFRGKNLE